MALIKHTGWPLDSGSFLSDFFDDDDDGFLNYPTIRHSMPAVSVKENNTAFEVEVFAPGFHRDDFNVSVENRFLTISAYSNRAGESEHKLEHPSFSRSFSLPDNVDENKILTKYEHGILKLTISKREARENSKPL